MALRKSSSTRKKEPTAEARASAAPAVPDKTRRASTARRYVCRARHGCQVGRRFLRRGDEIELGSEHHDETGRLTSKGHRKVLELVAGSPPVEEKKAEEKEKD